MKPRMTVVLSLALLLVGLVRESPAPDISTFGGVSTSTANTWTAAQSFTEVSLTDAATITWNWSTQQRATVTLAANRTLGNPTADTFPAGRMATLRVIQDGGGSNTLAYSSAYDFVGGEAPTLTTAGNAVDFLSCYSDATNILCTISLDMK